MIPPSQELVLTVGSTSFDCVWGSFQNSLSSRQDMGEQVSFYAVTDGRCSGIFTSWSRVLDATVGYPGAKVDKFSTLAEAEQFMNENASTTRGNQVADDWSGPVYAVAVGRRMGIFRDRSVALQQTFRYSGNSLKKFSSYRAAVKFLDHHHWWKLPQRSNDSSGVTLSTENVDDCLNAKSRVVSSEELSFQDTVRPEITPKRERDDEGLAEEIRSTQRRRIDSEPPLLKEGIYALCFGSLNHDSQGRETVKVVCKFPLFPEWNVQQTLHDPKLTATGAGLLAVLETLKCASREDPNCDVDVTIFTINRPLFDVLCKCVDDGWQSVSEDHDLLRRISQEKSGRCVNVLHLGGACKWGVEQSEGDQQITGRSD